MKKKHFLKQLDYELWANNMLIQAISDAHTPEERVYELLAHILIAPNNWLKRIFNEKPTFKLWDKLDLEDCSQLSQVNYEEWKKFILNKTDEELEQHIFFPFTGEPSKISIEDLLTHLVNHSSYHRGQIIIKLKGKLEQLPLTTYIAFATEKI